MSETEAQRRERLAERVSRIWDDERYSMALKAYLVEEETKVAERDIAAMEPREPCERCKSSKATLAPCPYANEILDDDTPVWLCDHCRDERAADI